MANKFVWSGAGGLNDGSSWENAYTSLMRDWGAEAAFTPATDFIYVRSIHAESAAAALTITGTTPETTESPVRVLSVAGAATGSDPGALAAGASVTSTGGINDIVINERIYIHGVAFHSGDDIAIAASPTDHDIVLESVTLELAGTSAADQIIIGNNSGVGSRIQLDDVTVTFGNISQGFNSTSGSIFWSGGSVTTNQTTLFEVFGTRTSQIFVSSLDLSVVQGTILDGAAPNADATIKFSRCLLHASATLIGGTLDVPGADIEIYHCQSGTDADPAFQMQRDSSRGRVKVDTSRYRTGGASDGVRANPVSWDIDTTAGSVRGYPGHGMISPPIVGWTPGDGVASHTYRVYFASDATINDEELWLEIVLPNDAATNSLGVRKSTRVAPRGTPAAYTTDAVSAWTGLGVGTKQYMQLTHTPDKQGPFEARVVMAKASDNVYIDPKVYVDP